MTWGQNIEAFRPPDTQPLPPRITAKGKSSKGWHHQEDTKRDTNRGLMLAVLFQAADDYHQAKAVQRKAGITTERQLQTLMFADMEKIRLGKSAWEWFTQPPMQGIVGYSFPEICKYFNVSQKRLWWRIKNLPDIRLQLWRLRMAEAMNL